MDITRSSKQLGSKQSWQCKTTRCCLCGNSCNARQEASIRTEGGIKLLEDLQSVYRIMIKSLQIKGRNCNSFSKHLKSALLLIP